MFAFGRVNIPSDPVINFYDPVVSCTFCGGKGHSKLSCRYAKAKTTEDISYDDMIFWSYVHPEDRPECLKDVEMDESGLSDSESDSESESESDSESDSESLVESDRGSDPESDSKSASESEFEFE